MQPVHVIDLSHHNDPVDLHALKAFGAVGVILKAGEGASYADPKFKTFRARAVTVFDEGCVHSYFFLDGSDPKAQMANYLSITAGMPGRWLDYEQNASQCSLETAITACQVLQGKQGTWPGMYGSDKSALGAAMDAGHFSPCPKWIAEYDHKPSHPYSLWQFSETGTIGAMSGVLDLSTFNGSAAECKAFLRAMAGFKA